MRNRWIVALLMVVSLGLGRSARADTVYVQPFFPGDGIWIFYQSGAPAYFLDVYFVVYCGGGCSE